MGVLELLKENFAAAEAHSLKAIELNPSDAYIKARVAGVLTYVGDAARGLVLLDQAEALDLRARFYAADVRAYRSWIARYRDASRT